MAKPIGPHIPAEYKDGDILSIRAVSDGEASPEQQKHALDWIINQASKTYDLHYYPQSDSETYFSLGRGFVGQQIVKLLKLRTEGER